MRHVHLCKQYYSYVERTIKRLSCDCIEKTKPVKTKITFHSWQKFVFSKGHCGLWADFQLAAVWRRVSDDWLDPRHVSINSRLCLLISDGL